jgi:ribosomal protein S14
MLKQASKNYIQRGFYKMVETKSLFTKIIYRYNFANALAVFNTSISRYLYNEIMSLYHRFSSASRIRSICIFSGRTRGVYRMFRLSRMNMREQGNAGFLIGLAKAS